MTERLYQRRPLRVLSLFSGIGGFDLAATWAGMEIAGQVEIDPFCRKVLAKHWSDVPRMADIHDVQGDEFGPIDLVVGGFPCQPYSVAGKRSGAADDRALWPQMRRVIDEARPRWIVAENVPGFIGLGLDDLLADLETLGYETGTLVVPAASVGAPHLRYRLWVVAADAAGGGLRRGGAPGQAGQPAQLREADAVAGGERRGAPHGVLPAGWDGPLDERWWDVEPCVRTLDDGLPGELPTRDGGWGVDRDQLILSAIAQGFLLTNPDEGTVWRTRSSGGRASSEPIPVTGSNLNGYRACKLVIEGQRKMIRLHHILWVSVNGSIPDGLQIDHINRDRSDNRIQNLRLVDGKGNAENKDILSGERNPSAKVSDEEASLIYRMWHEGNILQRQIADEFGLSTSQVSNICRGQRKGLARHRVSQLKALGNSIIPQVAYEIIRHLPELDGDHA